MLYQFVYIIVVFVLYLVLFLGYIFFEVYREITYTKKEKYEDIVDNFEDTI